MAAPDYLICLNCESPAYVFDWNEGDVKEALCEVCGNEDPDEFISPTELEELTGG